MTRRMTYHGPVNHELDRRQWEGLYNSLDDTSREWVNNIAGQLCRHTSTGNLSAIPNMGVHGARELAVKLLIFLAKDGHNGKQ